MRWPYPRTPKLAIGLPSSFDEGQRELDRRAKLAFPVGSSEARLVSELIRDGFSIDKTQADCSSATLTRGIVLRELWSVRWTAQDDKIMDVWAVYGIIAP
jgi:hypothetical protein